MAYYNPYQMNSGNNNYFGQPYYGNYQAAPQSMAAPAPIQNQNGVNWVQGEVGARAYPLAPGQMAVLMDSEDSVFYIKAVDQYGMPQPLKKFRFTEETMAQQSQKNLPQQQDMSNNNYMTRDEFEKRLQEKLDEITR